AATIVTPPTSRAPSPTLFPYTPLFRSRQGSQRARRQGSRCRPCSAGSQQPRTMEGDDIRRSGHRDSVCEARAEAPEARHRGVVRSEEHTSELQSRENLVCRLLLEKKKK